jgi:hypothetical protein
MTSPIETALNHQTAAQDDQDMLELSPDLAGPLRADDPQPAFDRAWQPDATAVADLEEEPEEEPVVTGQNEAERSMTSALPGAEAEPIPESSAASATATMSTRWHDIQVMFVDDPRASAEMAAGLVDDSIQALVAFVREQQVSMLADWHGEDAGTEELRTAVQHYRAFGTHLADFSRET